MHRPLSGPSTSEVEDKRAGALRVVTWNTQGVSKKSLHKLDLVCSLGPHILALQECYAGAQERLAELGFETRALVPAGGKGICLAVREPCRLAAPEPGTEEAVVPKADRMPPDVLSVRLDRPRPLVVDVMWIHPTPGQQRAGYVAKMKSILEARAPDTQRVPHLTLGDFNSSDALGPAYNPTADLSHAGNVRRLEMRGQISAYQYLTGEKSGQEGPATHWHMWRRDRPFFIDHVFVPRAWADSLRACQVLQDERWSSVSDHFPVVVDIDRAGL